MTDSIDDIMNSHIDDNVENLVAGRTKVEAEMVFQGTKSALKSVAYNSYNDANVVSTFQKAFCDNFNGTALDTTKWDLIQQGAGMTLTVNNGLTIASGVTANSETILLSKQAFTVSHRAMFDFTPSQKIANQECHLELVSVDANGNVEASGILDYASWIWEMAIATTTATGIYRVQSGGTNLYTSPSNALGLTQTFGGILELNATPDEVWFYAKQKNSATARVGSFVHQTRILNPSKTYKLRIRIKNLATAPATNTNFVFGKVSCTDYSEMPVEVTGGVGSSSAGEALPVNVVSVPTTTVTGTVNATSTGNVAEGTAVSGNPIRIASQALTACVATTTGTIKGLISTLYGAIVQKPYSIPEHDFQYTGTLTTTTAVALKVAGGAGIRNYLTGLTYQNTGTVATTIIVLDGATVIFTLNAPASMAMPAFIEFPTPLKGTAVTALNVNCGTTGASVLVNAQGYQAP